MACCASWSASGVNAQPAIDPTTELIRQQERQREQRSRQEPEVDIHLAGEPQASLDRLPLNESPCFKIGRIAIDLAPSADTEKFLWLPESLAGANHDDAPVGKCLGSRGIAMVVKRAQDALSAQGFATSRVFAKPQDLSGGTLTLSVVPGRVRAIRFAEQAPPASLPRAALWNNAATRTGDILTLNDIEQTLENLKRVGATVVGVAADAVNYLANPDPKKFI